MSRKPVSHTFDTLPPLTEKQRQHLEALAAKPDDTIDLSDMPELTDAQLAEMRPAAHYRPVKKQITARVDADVLAWLKSQGKGYQSRINAILRREMLEQRQAQAKALHR
ncbi:BrnA antitoxin family protein [Paracoccus sp. SSK6]|uniref:BrnA antitoxin family protein n=1 Tax=Paracoccus sp. SSK6 TaxID=3143131 RepID=UPI00321BA43E